MNAVSNIPRIIHYCWLGGGEMNHILKKCVSTFDLLEGKIIRWDENNFPKITNQYTQWLFDRKDWGFVSDYLRLWVLYEYGGLYLDTDIEVRKKNTRILL